MTFWNSTTLTDLGSVGLAMIDASVLRKMREGELRAGMRRVFVEDEYFLGTDKYQVSLDESRMIRKTGMRLRGSDSTHTIFGTTFGHFYDKLVRPSNR